jgi:hypothetical protein
MLGTKTVAEFGHLIGGLFHMLMTTASGKRPWEKFLRGIVNFYVTIPDGHPIRRRRKLDEIISFGLMEHTAKTDMPDILNKSSVSDSTIESIPRTRNYANSEYQYSVMKSTGDMGGIFEDTMDIIADNGLVPHRTLAISIVPTIDDFNITTYKSQIRRNLNELMKNTRLKDVNQIIESIQKDTNILTKEWRGPDRDNIVKTVFQADRELTSREIASEVDKAIVDNLVTTALNKMSDESDNQDLLTEYFLFERHNSGWELTPYGELCARSLIGTDVEDSLYRYVLDIKIEDEYEELISQVLNQVNSK